MHLQKLPQQTAQQSLIVMNKIVLKIKELISKVTDKLGYKNTYILCSFIITFIFGLLNIILGIFIGCFAGLIREAYNYIKYMLYQEGIGSNKENLVYDVIGITMATIILLIL